MRNLSVLVASVALAVAGHAQAAAVNFTGTLSVQVSTLPPTVASGSGVAILNGSGGLGALVSLDVAGGTFAATASAPVTDPAAFPIGGNKTTASNGAGSFTGGAGLNGVMPIIGTSNVCLFAACNGGPVANVNVPFTVNGTRGIGIGGGPIAVAGLVNVTVNGSPWTVGTAMVGTVTVSGFIHGPASGGAESAANASGVVRLVTPTTVNTNIGASPTLPAFGIMTLHFDVVPEPGTLLLVATGAAGLGLLGRKRSSR